MFGFPESPPIRHATTESTDASKGYLHTMREIRIFAAPNLLETFLTVI